MRLRCYQGQLTTAWTLCYQSLLFTYMHIALCCRALHTQKQHFTSSQHVMLCSFHHRLEPKLYQFYIILFPTFLPIFFTMFLSPFSFFLPISSSFSSLVSSQPYFPSTFLPYFLPYLLPFFPPYFIPDFLSISFIHYLSIFFPIFLHVSFLISLNFLPYVFFLFLLVLLSIISSIFLCTDVLHPFFLRVVLKRMQVGDAVDQLQPVARDQIPSHTSSFNDSTYVCIHICIHVHMYTCIHMLSYVEMHIQYARRSTDIHGYISMFIVCIYIYI